ncbi:MAG TPA: hypothetical protein VMM13_08925, partial [Euzebya sp.]|nr:hypothetical protein [Euzebya sp.]
SSSDVRARFGSGRTVRYLIPREVEEFARKHGLYGTHGRGLAAADVTGRRHLDRERTQEESAGHGPA